MARQLRFCMITTFYPPYNFGGDGIFVHNLTDELARRGHQVEVIHCMDAYRSLSHRKPDTLTHDHPNITVHRLESPFGLLSPLATHQTGLPVFKASRIRQILDKGFDVIHYHNVSLVGGPGVLKYGQGIKLYTMHDYWLFCPTHVMFKFNRAPCSHPYCLACTLVHRRPPQWWRYFSGWKSALNHVDAFIAPSHFITRIFREKGLDARIVHLPHFVSPDQPVSPDMRTFHPLKEEPYFLFVGRLEKIKGVEGLISAFQNFRGTNLLIAGTGADENRLRTLANNGNVHFLGHVPRRQLGLLYREAVALIVPSLCYEIFPLVILESFQQKTPVIARNLGGTPESVEESGGGLTFRDDTELVAAMERLATDSRCRRELGLRAYDAYQRKWTAEAHLQGYFALIDEIAERKSESGDKGMQVYYEKESQIQLPRRFMR